MKNPKIKILNQKIYRLISYIKNLKDFKILKPEIPVPYNHMGATITDTILQAGISWKTVVKPRVKNILKHSKAKTTTGFLNLMEEKGINNLLKWKGDKKAGRVFNITKFLSGKNVETEEDLKKWFKKSANDIKLKK